MQPTYSVLTLESPHTRMRAPTHPIAQLSTQISEPWQLVQGKRSWLWAWAWSGLLSCKSHCSTFVQGRSAPLTTTKRKAPQARRSRPGVRHNCHRRGEASRLQPRRPDLLFRAPQGRAALPEPPVLVRGQRRPGQCTGVASQQERHRHQQGAEDRHLRGWLRSRLRYPGISDWFERPATPVYTRPRCEWRLRLPKH